jgi:hypothetical protein
MSRHTWAIVAFLGACGDNASPIGGDAATIDASIDAPPAGPCWPVDGTTTGGTIQLGGGEGDFVAMPDELPVVFGSQNGYHIPVNARMTGMVPGNQTNVLDPINPRTRFGAFFVDTGEPINGAKCPIRLAYKPASDGSAAFDLLVASAVLFEVGLPEDQIFERQVRVVVEIIDHDGTYATDEKVITCKPPM